MYDLVLNDLKKQLSKSKGDYIDYSTSGYICQFNLIDKSINLKYLKRMVDDNELRKYYPMEHRIISSIIHDLNYKNI